MPLICDEILLLADVSLDAVEFRYVLILSDALPVVSGSVLLMLAVFLKLDDLAGTGGGNCDAVVFVVVSVIIRLSVTVVIVIVSTTYLWFNCLADDRIFFEFDAPPVLFLPSAFAYFYIHLI